ncbi:MAG: GNAT family N-acetyltransferase [Chloroflexi bacterium]|nr:GNAT family N-acetyltransferase [Chloroflexota bacterium]
MTVLTDFSTEAVDAAAESNWKIFVEMLKSLDGGEVHIGDDLTHWIFPTLPHPLFNMVTGARLDTDVDDVIKATMERYISRNLALLWEIEPSNRPADLGERLVAHGMHALGQFPILAIDLSLITTTMDAPKNFHIERVSNEELLQAFRKAFQPGFEFPDFAMDAFDPLMREGFREDAIIQNYVGFLDGEPVSASSTLYGGGIAGFYNGTVLESARGMGIGTANTVHRIHEAKKRGYRIGFMISGGNAYNLYKRLGFKDCTPWQRYIWMPDGAEGH